MIFKQILRKALFHGYIQWESMTIHSNVCYFQAFENGVHSSHSKVSTPNNDKTWAPFIQSGDKLGGVLPTSPSYEQLFASEPTNSDDEERVSFLFWWQSRFWPQDWPLSCTFLFGWCRRRLKFIFVSESCSEISSITCVHIANDDGDDVLLCDRWLWMPLQLLFMM